MQVKTLACLFVGADGFEPPKSKDSRFTVCPIWPLWNLPSVWYSNAKLHFFLQRTAEVNHFYRRYRKFISFISDDAS